MKKIFNFVKSNFEITKFFSIFFSIIMFLIVYLCAFESNKIEYMAKVDFEIDNYLIPFCGIAMYCIIFVIAKILKKIFKNKIGLFILFFSIFFAVFLFFITKNYCFKTGWDVSYMLQNAELIANNTTTDWCNLYNSFYPNNIFLTECFSLAFRLANYTKIGSGYLYLLFVQCCIYSFTGFVVFKIVSFIKKDGNAAIIAWIGYILLIGLSPWVVIPYSDSIGVGLVGLEVLMFCKALENKENNKKVFLYSSLFTFFAIIGYFIKPQILIFFIAGCIGTTIVSMRNIKNKQAVKKYFKIIVCVLLTGMITFLLSKYISRLNKLEINKESKMGITHFLMMGWNEKDGGIYSNNDYIFSTSFQTQKERRNANIAEFKLRIKNLGKDGIIKMLKMKTLTNYNDGTFAFDKEGGFVQEDYPYGKENLRRQLKKIYLPNGMYYKKFQLTMQVIWMGTLFFNMIFYNYSKNKKVFVIQLAILGLTLFELLFEARARYLFTYASLYIILAALSIENVVDKCKYLYNKIIKTKKVVY